MRDLSQGTKDGSTNRSQETKHGPRVQRRWERERSNERSNGGRIKGDWTKMERGERGNRRRGREREERTERRHFHHPISAVAEAEGGRDGRGEHVIARWRPRGEDREERMSASGGGACH